VIALLFVALPAPGAHAKPRCLGKVATIVGTSGDDTLQGTAKADVIVTRGGDDAVAALAGNDLVCGGAGVDALFGQEGNDRLAGGAGADQISGGVGNDSIDGGRDFDYVNYYFSPAGVNVDLGAGSGTGEGTDALKGIENVFGSPFADSIMGSEGTNLIAPLGGNDTVDARGALDIVYDGVGPQSSGTDGDDILDGGDGLDAVAYTTSPGPVNASLASGTATGNGTDTIDGMEGIWGSPFDDVLTGDSARNLLLPNDGNDQVDGGGANDAAAFWFASTGPVTADISSGTASGEGSDTLTGIEGLLGSVAFGDVLRGNDQTNLLDGDAGDDQLFGEGGNDWLTGGVGNDQIDGGAGDYDIADFSTTAFLEVTAAVTVSLEAGTATGQGSDALSGIESIRGSELGDTLTGDAGPNVLFGLGGNDRIFGLAGNDSLDAGQGRDDADGGLGTDQCVDAEADPNCEGGASPLQHPALADAKVIEDFRRNFRRNF
jgi:Ca2+-binding RTX toxin-like protein